MLKRVLLIFVFIWLIGSVAAQDEPTFTIRKITVENPAVEAELSPNGQSLVAYANAIINEDEPTNPYLWLMDFASGTLIKRLTGPSDYARDVAFSPDGTWLASFHQNGDIFLWDAATGELVRTFEMPFYGGGRLKFLRDNHTLLLQHGDPNQLILLDTETGYITGILAPHFDNITQFRDTLSEVFNRMAYVYPVLEVAPDGVTLAVANANDRVFLWDLTTREQQTLRPESEDKARFDLVNLSYSSDGKTLAYLHRSAQEIHLFDVATYEESAVLTLQADAFALSPDSSAIAWMNREDNTVYFAPIDQTDTPVTVFTLPEAVRVVPRVTSLTFTPDGQSIIVAGVFGSDSEDGGSSVYVATHDN